MRLVINGLIVKKRSEITGKMWFTGIVRETTDISKTAPKSLTIIFDKMQIFHEGFFASKGFECQYAVLLRFLELTYFWLIARSHK